MRIQSMLFYYVFPQKVLDSRNDNKQWKSTCIRNIMLWSIIQIVVVTNENIGICVPSADSWRAIFHDKSKFFHSREKSLLVAAFFKNRKEIT